jgi:hypothetical protein
MSPRIDQLVESRIEELRHQAAQQRPIRRVPGGGPHDARRAIFERVKSRLGSCLVVMGQRLQTTSTQSHLA